VLVGGLETGAGNLIAYNLGEGVAVIGDGATGNTIRGNSIHSNGRLGIDLGFDGVTPNDDGNPTAVPPIPPDLDAGPNELQNTPVLTSAIFGSTTRVAGQLRSTPNSTFRIDFYANTAADPSGFGEGERWLGTITVKTSDDEFGTAGFSTEVADAVVGEFITATATNAAGSTSEFSSALVVRGRPTRGGGRPTAGGLVVESEPAQTLDQQLASEPSPVVLSAARRNRDLGFAGDVDNDDEWTAAAVWSLPDPQESYDPDALFADFNGSLADELLTV
jgi:hypothetical protein